MYYNRLIEPEVLDALKKYAIVAILGPRQVGKSTLAKFIIAKKSNTIYLDLERPSDLNKLEDAEWFFQSNKGSFFCIDEIQRKPELFPVIRSLVDDWGGKGHFLILGSASQDLLRQSSETLAGRISYHKLSPFSWAEISDRHSIEDYLLKGGFPGSLMTNKMNDSLRWRENFISTFLERDLLQWSSVSPQNIRRLWQMLSYVNGQIVNYSTLGNSLGISNTSVKNYIDLLNATYMLEILPPYLPNSGKRLIKSPKVYFADTGLINSFSGVLSFNQLSAHPSLGSVWESLVLLNMKASFPYFNYYFYRTSHGAEIDFIIEYGSKIVAIECKASLSPKPSKGNFISMKDIKAEKILVVFPGDSGWEKSRNIHIVSIQEAIDYVRKYFGRE